MSSRLALQRGEIINNSIDLSNLQSFRTIAIKLSRRTQRLQLPSVWLIWVFIRGGLIDTTRWTIFLYETTLSNEATYFKDSLWSMMSWVPQFKAWLNESLLLSFSNDEKHGSIHLYWTKRKRTNNWFIWNMQMPIVYNAGANSTAKMKTINDNKRTQSIIWRVFQSFFQ